MNCWVICLDDIQTILSSKKSVPRSRFHYPMTEQQELGWYNDEMVFVTNSK